LRCCIRLALPNVDDGFLAGGSWLREDE
jgi:hypothetical protein